MQSSLRHVFIEISKYKIITKDLLIVAYLPESFRYDANKNKAKNFLWHFKYQYSCKVLPHRYITQKRCALFTGRRLADVCSSDRAKIPISFQTRTDDLFLFLVIMILLY